MEKGGRGRKEDRRSAIGGRPLRRAGVFVLPERLENGGDLADKVWAIFVGSFDESNGD